MVEDIKEMIIGCLETYADVLIKNTDEEGKVTQLQIKALLVAYCDLIIDKIDNE